MLPCFKRSFHSGWWKHDLLSFLSKQQQWFCQFSLPALCLVLCSFLIHICRSAKESMGFPFKSQESSLCADPFSLVFCPINCSCWSLLNSKFYLLYSLRLWGWCFLLPYASAWKLPLGHKVGQSKDSFHLFPFSQDHCAVLHIAHCLKTNFTYVVHFSSG